MKKKVLLFISLSIPLFFSCSKDKNVEETKYPIEIKENNVDRLTGLEVGQAQELTYDVKANYDVNISQSEIKYELVSDNSDFEASDNQGNDVLELGKTYLLKENPLKISYKGKGKGTHSVKVVFSNSKGNTIESKETKLFFDGFGFNMKLKKTENYTGIENVFEYSIKKMDNRDVSYEITVVEDEGNGTFFLKNKNDNSVIQQFRKGESVILNSSDSSNNKAFSYVTNNVTPTNSRAHDKIVLKVKPYSGNQSQEETLVFLVRNVKFDFEATATFDRNANPFIMPNQMYSFKLNIVEENPLAEELNYDYVAVLDQVVNFVRQNGKKFKFYLDREGKQEITDDTILLKKGEKEIFFKSENMIVIEDLPYFHSELHIKVSNKNDMRAFKVADVEFILWGFPNLSFTIINGYGTGDTRDIRLDNSSNATMNFVGIRVDNFEFSGLLSDYKVALGITKQVNVQDNNFEYENTKNLTDMSIYNRNKPISGFFTRSLSRGHNSDTFFGNYSVILLYKNKEIMRYNSVFNGSNLNQPVYLNSSSFHKWEQFKNYSNSN